MEIKPGDLIRFNLNLPDDRIYLCIKVIKKSFEIYKIYFINENNELDWWNSYDFEKVN